MLIYRNNRDGTWVLIDDFEQVWHVAATGDRARPLEMTLLSGAFATPEDQPREAPPDVPPPPLARFGVD